MVAGKYGTEWGTGDALKKTPIPNSSLGSRGNVDVVILSEPCRFGGHFPIEGWVSSTGFSGLTEGLKRQGV